MNVRFINEHNEIVNEPNEIMVVHDILSQKTLQTLEGRYLERRHTGRQLEPWRRS